MPARLSRRRFHQGAAVAAAGVAFGVRPAAAAEPHWPTYPRMMQRYFEAKFGPHARRIKEELAAVDLPEAAAAHAADVRKRLAKSFGPKPERTPLNAKVVRTLDRDGYRIEALTYESRPGLLVTANLYLPDATPENPGPFPGVLGVCGHAGLGKAQPAYQAFGVELAKAGFATLIIDPIGQGERYQWPVGMPATGAGRSLYGGPVGEHNQLDRLMRPTGQWFGTWRSWDGVRGIDYLEQREDVSTEPFLGVTGNSGGGTMTCLLAAWDERITAAASSCFVTTLSRNLRNELPA
ncbi:MAG: twin-arginine translocation signal domain-containing protein, partial [Planctomycetota bacterium]